VTLTATASAPLANVSFRDGATWIGSAAFVANQASVTVSLPAGIHTLSAVMFVEGSNSDSAPITQVVDVPLVCN